VEEIRSIGESAFDRLSLRRPIVSPTISTPPSLLSVS
jgi:hypothetical protein